MSAPKSLFWLILSCVFIFSCSKPSPQLPSNKGNVADKNDIALLELNQNLIRKEDSILTLFANQTDSSFKKSQIGFWYKIDLHTNNAQVRENDKCSLTYKLLSLDMKVIKSEKKDIVIGKKQLIVGLEEGLKLLNRGEKASFIIPWNLGYGRSGLNHFVKPYTSVIYKVELE